MNGLSVIFDGVELSDYLKITDLQRDIGTSRTNNTVKIGNSDGERYLESLLEKKIITISFALRYDLTKKRRELANLLNAGEPRMLIFGDEPDKYYMAIIDGDIPLLENNFLGKGTINWLIPDGVAHSVNENISTNRIEATEISDLKEKISGSDVENPHIIRKTADTVLIDPSVKRGELTQREIDGITDLDGKITTIQNKTKDNFVQIIQYFDLVTDIDRRHPGLFESYGATTTAQKVAVSRVIVKSLYAHTHGYGSGATGKGLTISAWDGQWRGRHTNETDKIVDLFYKDWDNPTAINRFITDDGKVIMIAYAPASDGVTPSAVNLDYVSLEYTLAYADNTIKVQNNGSYKTYPILEATMRSDNGVVAFINGNGALLQFGNPSEVDTVGYQKSEWLVSDKDMTKENAEASGWKVNDVTFADHMDRKVVANGDVLYKTVLSDGRTAHAVGISDFGVGSQYRGASLSRKIAADSEGRIGAKNFEAHFSAYFATGRINQTGLSIIDVRDSKGKSIAGVSFTKNSSTNNVSGLRLHVNGKVIFTQWFNTTVWNIYTKLGATFYIYKSGGYFEFHMGGIINGGFAKTYRDESLAEVEATELVWFGGIYGNSTSTLENYLISASFLKNNVDKVADIPNRFGTGDKLIVDVASAAVYLNGLEMNGFGALGNDYEQFFLSPGANEILCICSDWVSQENFPEFVAKYREAYL